MSLTAPSNNAVAFATSGLKNIIPVSPLPGGAASMTQGFPPVTMQPISAGGIPPSGQDVNGILHQLSSHQVYLNAGGMYKFNAAHATAIGGYGKGAVLQSDDELSAYISIISNNSNNPNTGGIGWKPYGGQLMEDRIVSLQVQVAGLSTTLGGVVNLIYPIGVIIDFGHASFNPNMHFSGTSWVRHAEGKASVGYSTQSADPVWTKAVGNTFGEYEHQLTVDEMPEHKHQVKLGDAITSGESTSISSGGGLINGGTFFDNQSLQPEGAGVSHNNVQPSIVDARWRRVA